MARLRALELTKSPGISEAITWARALTVLRRPDPVGRRGGRHDERRLKYPEDEQTVREAGLASVIRHD